MRSKISLFVLLTIFAFACDKDDDKTPSQEELLTGNSTKSWKLSTNSSDANEDDESCKASSDLNLDNQWKFTKGGYFEFDRGTVTGDDCELCTCSDIINVYGTWQISGGKLHIIAIGELTGNTKAPFDAPEDIMNETLKSLTKDKFEISYDVSGLATFVPFN